MNLVRDFFVNNDDAAIYLDKELFERNKEIYFYLIF